MNSGPYYLCKTQGFSHVNDQNKINYRKKKVKNMNKNIGNHLDCFFSLQIALFLFS